MEEADRKDDKASSVQDSTLITRRDLLVVTGAAAVYGAVGGQTVVAGPLSDLAVTTLPVRLKINGEEHSLDIDPRQSILDLLRERLALAGTKKGCNQGACGACTVLIDGKRVNSCLTLAVMHEGTEITTIEGLAEGDELHPLQAAFIKHDGFQCGYCTSGQIMSGVACISEGHADSQGDIQFWMSGNICRCGAYPGICAAISDTAAARI